ncbi:MAG: hypothetical protein ABJA74_10900 [Lapillicoccus sp.]
MRYQGGRGRTVEVAVAAADLELWGNARRLRLIAVDGAAAARGAAEARGLSTGRFGRRVGAHDRAIRTVIAVLAAAVILLLRPLSISDVLWVAVLAILALLLVLLLIRTPAGEGEDMPTPSQPELT